MSDVLHITRARKEIAILVERDRHHSVRTIERLFNTISVMDINVNVQNTMMELEKLQYCQHNVVRIAKPRGFGFLGVMQASSPIDCYVTKAMVQSHRSCQATTSVATTVVEEALERRAVLSHIESPHTLHEFCLVFRIHAAQEVYVVIGMECLELLRARQWRP